MEAAYAIAAEHADAWMVKLTDGVVGSISGRVHCADALMRPDLWKEQGRLQ